MAIPVLKNRVLLITNRDFSEAKYGALTFREFLRQAPEIVRLDESTYPVTAEFVEEYSERIDVGPTPFTRVRSDLWQAIMDYSSGKRYLWDSAAKSARPAEIDEDPQHTLPTVSEEELNIWRTDFATKHKEGADSQTSAKLETWNQQRLRTFALPSQLRPAWNMELKTRVEERLRKWFQQQQLEAPQDLVRAESIVKPASMSTGKLRDLIIECVRVMTDRELSEFRISAATILRLLESRSRSDE